MSPQPTALRGAPRSASERLASCDCRGILSPRLLCARLRVRHRQRATAEQLARSTRVMWPRWCVKVAATPALRWRWAAVRMQAVARMQSSQKKAWSLWATTSPVKAKVKRFEFERHELAAGLIQTAARQRLVAWVARHRHVSSVTHPVNPSVNLPAADAEPAVTRDEAMRTALEARLEVDVDVSRFVYAVSECVHVCICVSFGGRCW